MNTLSLQKYPLECGPVFVLHCFDQSTIHLHLVIIFVRVFLERLEAQGEILDSLLGGFIRVVCPFRDGQCDSQNTFGVQNC